MEIRPGNGIYLIDTNDRLDDLRREAHDEALMHEAHRRRRAGRLPQSVGHALIFLGRIIAAEPTC